MKKNTYSMGKDLVDIRSYCKVRNFSRAKLEAYVQRLECEYDKMQKCFVHLISQSKRMKYRPQPAEEAPHKHATILEDLERFCCNPREACSDIIRTNTQQRTLGAVRCKQELIISQLRAQLNPLQGANLMRAVPSGECNDRDDECRRKRRSTQTVGDGPGIYWSALSKENCQFENEIGEFESNKIYTPTTLRTSPESSRNVSRKSSIKSNFSANYKENVGPTDQMSKRESVKIIIPTVLKPSGRSSRRRSSTKSNHSGNNKENVGHKDKTSKRESVKSIASTVGKPSSNSSRNVSRKSSTKSNLSGNDKENVWPKDEMGKRESVKIIRSAVRKPTPETSRDVSRKSSTKSNFSAYNIKGILGPIDQMSKRESIKTITSTVLSSSSSSSRSVSGKSSTKSNFSTKSKKSRGLKEGKRRRESLKIITPTVLKSSSSSSNSVSRRNTEKSITNISNIMRQSYNNLITKASNKENQENNKSNLSPFDLFNDLFNTKNSCFSKLNAAVYNEFSSFRRNQESLPFTTMYPKNAMKNNKINSNSPKENGSLNSLKSNCAINCDELLPTRRRCVHVLQSCENKLPFSNSQTSAKKVKKSDYGCRKQKVTEEPCYAIISLKPETKKNGPHKKRDKLLQKQLPCGVNNRENLLRHSFKYYAKKFDISRS